MTAQKPIIHGRDHGQGGADPVPGLLPTTGSYPVAVLSHPAVAHYWPADETSGDLADLVGGWGLARQANATAVPYPVYSVPGPVAGQTAVANTGAQGIPAGDQGCFSRSDAGSSMFTGTDPFTIVVWVYPTAYTLSYLLWVGDTSAPITIGLSSNKLHLSRGTVLLDDPTDLTLGTWHLVGLRYDGATLDYLHNDLGVVASAAAAGGVTVVDSLAWLNIAVGPAWYPITASSAQMAFFTDALDDAYFANLWGLAASGGGGSEGWILELDENGNPVWRPPTGVTVNGDEPAGATATQPPATPVPVDPADVFGAELQWIIDQPFTWDGASFDVAPNRWTTIPFASPLMERQSNVTGAGTKMTEIDPSDPAAAGWVDPGDPHAIIVPHDVLFIGDGMTWYQVCLRLESPAVGNLTSRRALRIFETTHQKTLVVAETWRNIADFEGGGVNVYRDMAAFTPVDGEIFASADLLGVDTGDHNNCMFMPGVGYGYHLPAWDWLPKNDAGQFILTQGMRLVAQAWQNTSETLTFHCDGSYPYRPHFVVNQTVDRAWGPPWSDWPIYTP